MQLLQAYVDTSSGYDEFTTFFHYRDKTYYSELFMGTYVEIATCPKDFANPNHPQFHEMWKITK